MPNNAVMTSATYNASGKFNFSLNGGYGVAPIAALPTNGVFTAEIQAKRAATATTVVAMGSSGTFWLGSASSVGVAHYGTGGTEVILTSTVNICDGNYHHLELDLSAAGGKFFIDGVLAASSATTMAAAGATYAAPLDLNIFVAPTGNAWGGEVDEGAVWAIARHSANFTPPTAAYLGTETGMMALYHLDQNGTDSAAPTFTANAITFTGASSGSIGVASTYTIGANGTTSGSTTVNLATSPDGTWSTGSVSFASGATATATYTPATAGAKTLTASDAAGVLTSAVITQTAVAGAVGFDSTKVLFSPYNWNVQAASAKTINPGAYFKANFTGASIALQFDMTNILTPLPQTQYRIDGYGPWTEADLAATITPTMPTDTATWPVHLIEFRFKSMTETQNRWSPTATCVSLVGISLASGGVLSQPPAASGYMLALGDSIKEGCRTVKALATPDVNSHDASLSSVPEIARLLGVEYGQVGFSATGYITAGAGAVPALTATYNTIYPGVARTFLPVPDFVMIDEGVNDTGDITAAATTVINGILAATPASTKVIVGRPLKDATHTTQLQAAIAASTAPSRCLFMDTTGFFNTANSSDGIHPFGVENITHIAPQVVAAIQPFVRPVRGARTARTITLTLVADAAGQVPRANLTGITGSIFDQGSPELLGVSAFSFTGGTTNSSGVFTQTVYSTLAAGAQVWLDMASSDKTMAFKGLATLS